MRFKAWKQMTDEFLSSAPVGGASSVTRGVTDNSVIWSSEQETEAQKHLEPSSQLARGWQVAKQRDLGTHLLSAPCAAAPPPHPAPPWPVAFPIPCRSSSGGADTQGRGQLREGDAFDRLFLSIGVSISMKLFLKPTFFKGPPTSDFPRG